MSACVDRAGPAQSRKIMQTRNETRSMEGSPHGNPRVRPVGGC
jgi:hypothetical protein